MSTATTEHAGLAVQPSLCGTPVTPPPTDPAGLLDTLAAALRHQLHRTGPATLTDRLGQAEGWHHTWTSELREARDVLDLAEDLAEPTPEGYAAAVEQLAAALRQLAPLLALLRHLLAARSGRDHRAARHARAAGHALDCETRAALLALALAVLVLAEHLGHRLAEQLTHRLALLLGLITEHPAPARIVRACPACTETLRRRALPTRAPPSRWSVTALA